MKQRSYPIFLLFLISTSAHAAVDHYSWGFTRIRENRGAIRLQFEPQGSLLGSAYRATGKVDAAVGLAHWFTFFLQARWTLQTLGPAVNYGFSDQTLGIHWRLFQSDSKKTQIGLQTQGDLPFFYVHATAAANGLPDLGDGSIDASAHLFWHQTWLPLDTWVGGRAELTSTLGTGGIYRSHFFSAALPWSFSAEISPAKTGLYLGATVHGQVSLRTDPFASGSVERPTSGSGGPLWSFATNPSWVSVGGSIGYCFSPNIQLSAAFQQGVWAQNAPRLTSAALQLRLRFGSESTSSEQSNRGFATYDLSTRVIRIRDSEHQVVIARGTNDGVAIGQVFDIFKEQGEKLNPSALARGKVSAALPQEAVIDIEEYFQEGLLNPQAVARRLLWRPH